MNLASSYVSSKSFGKLDDLGLVDQRVPEVVEQLPTGLRLVLDENFVSNVWGSEKQRDTLQDLLVDILIISGKVYEARRNIPKL